MGFQNLSKTPELLNLQALPNNKEITMKNAMQIMCHTTCNGENLLAYYCTNNEFKTERVGRGPCTLLNSLKWWNLLFQRQNNKLTITYWHSSESNFCPCEMLGVSRFNHLNMMNYDKTLWMYLLTPDTVTGIQPVERSVQDIQRHTGPSQETGVDTTSAEADHLKTSTHPMHAKLSKWLFCS